MLGKGLLLAQHRLDRLQLGPVAQLQSDGVRLAVLPLDEDDTLDAVEVASARTGKADPALKRAGDRGAVRRALQAGPMAVLLLGGGHDLVEKGRSQGQGRVEYLRVEVQAYRRLMGR